MTENTPSQGSGRNRFLQIKETCIYAHDLVGVREFYEGKLGLEVISFVAGKHVFFRAGTSVLLCFNPEDSAKKTSPPPHHAAGRYHFAFEVKPEDYQWQKDRIAREGIRISHVMTWESGQESFYFDDPAGNVVEVVPVGIW